MTDAEALEVVGRRLTPEVLCALAEHLVAIRGSARTEIVLHHGLDGVAWGAECYKRLKTVDVKAQQGVSSRR